VGSSPPFEIQNNEKLTLISRRIYIDNHLVHKITFTQTPTCFDALMHHLYERHYI
jgi:hypothetical protein